jgi:BirA family biotin operon repressor/biotin-[acetyl-CoA-carboxylase] ligase
LYVDSNNLQKYLADLPLGEVVFRPSLSSTNTEALHWAEHGAPHLSLMAADEQTAGKGRFNRSWFTFPGEALAFSLILRPVSDQFIPGSRIIGLGSLAVCDVLQRVYQLSAKIKWPNDVLIMDRKVAGVLVEAAWSGNNLVYSVLGIGINVARNSVPAQAMLDFPATSIEKEFGSPVDRWMLLKQVLEALLLRLQQIDRDVFIKNWEDNLAYRGQEVQILRDGAKPEEGRIHGLDQSGSLQLLLPSGKLKLVNIGNVKLRQVDRR